MGHWPPPDLNLQLRDLLVSSRSCDAFKEAVVTRTAPTEDQGIRQSLQGVEPGNKKPSGLLREMWRFIRALFGNGSILRELWLQRLPRQLHFLLIATRKYSLEETAETSDDIVSRYGSSVSALNSVSSAKDVLTFAGRIRKYFDESRSIATAANRS